MPNYIHFRNGCILLTACIECNGETGNGPKQELHAKRSKRLFHGIMQLPLSLGFRGDLCYAQFYFSERGGIRALSDSTEK